MTISVVNLKYALLTYPAAIFHCGLFTVLIRPLLRVTNVYWECQGSIFSMAAARGLSPWIAQAQLVPGSRPRCMSWTSHELYIYYGMILINANSLPALPPSSSIYYIGAVPCLRKLRNASLPVALPGGGLHMGLSAPNPHTNVPILCECRLGFFYPSLRC